MIALISLIIIVNFYDFDYWVRIVQFWISRIMNNTWAICWCWSMASSRTPWGRFDGSKFGKLWGRFAANPGGKFGILKFGTGSLLSVLNSSISSSLFSLSSSLELKISFVSRYDMSYIWWIVWYCPYLVSSRMSWLFWLTYHDWVVLVLLDLVSILLCHFVKLALLDEVELVVPSFVVVLMIP